MFCIRQYLSKEKGKREKNKNGIWFSFRSHTCTCVKTQNARWQFLVSCDSLVEPVSQTVILKIFHVGTANIPKAYSRNCSYFARGAKKTIYKQRNKERTKRNHPLLRQRE